MAFRQGLLRVAVPMVRSTQSQLRRYLSAISFAKSHEYIKMNGDTGTIGITSWAQNKLGDIVFVDLPEVGDHFQKGDTMAAVESVKSANDVYAPASGVITEINEALADTPDLVNESPLEDGWFVKMKLSDATEVSGLMSEADYAEHLKNEENK
mmetsp:Transcript_20952/g.27175  ORF Transcript_20952/g.27175 Transcript_20952/m.27175 type:complete len:153 (+) Transcript_20952:46-504(+)